MVVKNTFPIGEGEEKIDTNLRPERFEEYIGQERTKKGLQIIIEAAKKRGDALEHILFYGNPGLGKTTLAHIIAHEADSHLVVCSAPSLEKPADIASILTSLEQGDILFLDECHRLSKAIAETLYSAMEDYKLNIVLGKGAMARTMEIALPKFTLVAATTKIALLPAPFRSRFGATFQFVFYAPEEISGILNRSARILGVEASPDVISQIASRSRFTPRIANRILKRIRDFATIEGHQTISQEIASKALSFLEIDEFGLESGDRNILEAIISKFSGGPVGIRSLAAASSEEEDTILDIYEPYLMQIGFLERTPRGRIATHLAYKHLGMR